AIAGSEPYIDSCQSGRWSPSESISTISPLKDQFSRDLGNQDWAAVAASAEDLMTATEMQYSEMSRYAVSQEVHKIQATYLRALQELNQAAEEGSQAVVAATGNNPEIAIEHSDRAESHLRAAESSLGLATQAMDRYGKKSQSG
ncbi:MAG: hypothetical protein HGA55_02620, partial [Methanoregulaceae archaeon]|nr:hypothetical protein [Methanoregulaceae archaeon]